MTRSPFLSLLLPLVLVGLGCAKPEPKPVPKPAIQVRISSEPGNAAVFLAGHPLGATPQAVGVASVDDLLGMTATLNGEAMAEKRIRFLAMDQAEVIFYFDSHRSALGKTLGLSKMLVFDYGAGVTFAVSKADLKPEFLPLLQRQAQVIKSHFEGLDLYICGHTDSQGQADSNLSLSVNRARAVSLDLVGQGIASSRMKVQGFGSNYPVTTNDTPEGRAMNRRTEIILPQ